MIEQIIFWLFAGGALVSAAAVVSPQLTKTPVHAALALVVSFLFIAALYVLLAAHVLAVLQILVYAGAIMVLFLFVIMLLNLGEPSAPSGPWPASKVAAGIIVLFVVYKAALMMTVVGGSEIPDLAREDLASFGSLEAVGGELFERFLVPFELLGILLIVALVGALVLAKRSLEIPAPEGDDGAEQAAEPAP